MHLELFIQNFQMQKITLIISILSLLLSCGQVAQQPMPKKDALIFKTFIRPSFIESAEVTLSRKDEAYKIEFLLMEISRDDRAPDSFYYQVLSLSKNQFDSLKSDVVDKIFVRDSDKSKGTRDGIYVDFSMVHNADTLHLHLDNPGKGDGYGSYQITKTAFDNFRQIFKDSVIHDYLDDAESYIDRSKPSIRMSDNRAINRLRKIEFSR
jgi:hypothetical protein